MANLDDWKPVRRNTSRYLGDLEAYLAEFLPWSVRSIERPLNTEADDAIWGAARGVARRMVESVARSNAASWRKAIVERGTSLWQSRLMYAALRTEMESAVGLRVNELVAANARLIVNLPAVIAARTSTYIAQQQQRGIRSSAIVEELSRRLPLLKKSAAKTLARTEVAKAETALTQARSERLGIAWYEWATSEDQRVRPAHRFMDKILVAWSDAAAPEQLDGIPSKLGHYHPGGAPNCRCVALPLVTLDEVPWPHKVYSHGQVNRLSRREFEAFLGLPKAA